MTTGMPDFGALLAQAQQMQQQMMDAQEALADLLATGSAGGGLVTATVDGRGDLRSLVISPQAYDPDDSDAWETVADLVVAAVRDAKAVAEEQATASMAQVSEGLGDQIGDQIGGMLGGALGDLFGGPASDPAIDPATETEQPPELEQLGDRDADD